MANAKPRQPPGKHTKLPRVPAGSRLQKRPLTRPQPSPSSSSQNIYISTSTPLISAVKRVTKALDSSLRTSAAPKGASLQSRVDHLRRQVTRDEANGGRGGRTEVRVLGTGRAIQKVLQVAERLEAEGLYTVDVRTGTRGTVDDVVQVGSDGDEEEGEGRVRRVSVLELGVKLK